jgi:hypothetical protein
MSKNKSQTNALDGERDAKGRFVMGSNGGPGRPKGSRNALGEAFIEDVYRKWKRHGAEVIDAVIRDRPADFLKVCAGLLPKEAELNMTLGFDTDLFEKCQSFVQAFRLARKVIGVQISRDDEIALIEHYEAQE